MAAKKSVKQAQPATAVAGARIEISTGSLQVAYECVGQVPSRNGQQAVALANCLLEIEAVLRERNAGVVQAEPEPEKPVE